MQTIMPVIEVADVEASAAWYRDALGFAPGPLYGDPPAFCIVGRGGASIALDRARADRPLALNQYWAAYIYVDDLAPILEELARRGTTPVRGPEDTFYGMREVDIRDPNGHIICVAEDLGPPPSQ